MSAPLLRVVEDPRGLYFRLGRNDHTTLMQVLAAGAPRFSGAVLAASHERRQQDLRIELSRRGLETVLDPLAMELATPGGWEREPLRALDWAGEQIHIPGQFGGAGVAGLADPIAKFAAEKRYSAVIAPTHYINGVDDAWWPVDRRVVRRLRSQLDAAGRRDVGIYYRLALPRKVLLDREQRYALIGGLAELEIDAVWLCVHPVSARCGPHVLRSYVEFSQEFHRLQIPLVAERTGFAGLALLGFNAVGGIEAGVTQGEGFDAARLLNPPRKKDDEKRGFALEPRVYINRLGLFLTRKEATAFFEARGMKRRFGCQDRPCCRNLDDMLKDPRRHFVISRAQEVLDLGNAPAEARAAVYSNSILRPASDDVLHAAKLNKRFEADQKRLTEWRLALLDLQERGRWDNAVVAPVGRRSGARPRASRN